MGRASPHVWGDKTKQVLEPYSLVESKPESMALTGSGHHVVYDTPLLTNVADEIVALARNHKFFAGVDQYVLNPVDEEQCLKVSQIITRLQSNAEFAQVFWTGLFKDYPTLTKVFDTDLQTSLFSFYTELTLCAHDVDAATKLAKPYALKMLEGKFIQGYYWWRIAERLMDELDALPHVRTYEHNLIRLVVERATKIILNAMLDHPWIGSEASHPYSFEVGATRAVVDGGRW